MHETWIETTLGEVSSIQIGRTPPRKEKKYWTDDTTVRPFCTIADMRAWMIDPTREGVTELAESEGRAKRVPAGALLMSFKLTIGRVGFAARDMFPNEAIAWIQPSEDLLPAFLALWLSGNDLELEAGRAVKGKTLNSTSLQAIRVLLPALSEQRRIVDLIAYIDAELAAVDKVAKSGKAVRSAVLASLLSGMHEIPASYDTLLDGAA